MSTHLSMGAINIETLKYEHPKTASKNNKYKCPSCDKPVTFKKGKIKKPHYSHNKSDNPCHYYDRPNESQLHKEGKMVMKTLLDSNAILEFCRECNSCNKLSEPLIKINQDDYNDMTKAVIEHKFQYNESLRSADVALVQNGNAKCIFEICYKNKTKEEDRPEPWVEIDAEPFIKTVNSDENNDKLKLVCIRDYTCGICSDNERYRYLILERLRIKKEEQSNEKQEILNMGNEDTRIIERRIKQKNEERKQKNEERIRRENEERMWRETAERMQRDYEERIKREYEERLKKENDERIEKEEKMKREDELKKILLEQNKLCNGCKINYCKCANPKFVINSYNNTTCVNCTRRKCKCVRITSFFKIQ